MRKMIVFFVFLFALISLCAQEESSTVGVNGGIGTVIIGDETYMRFRLNPEITLGKLGLGLDIDLLLTEDGDIREEDWDDWKDYVNKLLYIRWSKRGDVFYTQVGAFPSYTLGPGLVINDYCNTLNYPQERQLGVMLGGRLPILDMKLEGFTSSITNPTLLAGRVSIAPLHNTPLPLLKNLRLGSTIGYDTDQYEGISEDEEELVMNSVDTDNDGIPDVNDFDPDGDGLFTEENLQEMGFTEEQIQQLINMGGFIDATEILDNPLEDLEENDLLVWGLDYELPLISSKNLNLSHYGELSQVVDHGYGFIFPGFSAQFSIFHLNLEYRQYEDDYIAGYFDHFYDADRAALQFNPDSGSQGEYEIMLKEDRLKEAVATRGWFGKLRADLFDFIYLEAGYTDMYADNDEDNLKSLTGTLGINTKIVPKLKNMEFKYYQVDVPEITAIIASHVIIRGTLRYELAPNTNLLWEYQERYLDVNDDGEIKGEDETERNVSMGVEFKF